MADIYFKVHFSASTIIFYQDLTSKYFSFKEKRFIENSQILLLLITCSFSLKKHKIFSVARWKSNLSMNIIAHHILHWLIVDNERIFELFKFLTVSFSIVTEKNELWHTLLLELHYSRGEGQEPGVMGPTFFIFR